MKYVSQPRAIVRHRRWTIALGVVMMSVLVGPVLVPVVLYGFFGFDTHSFLAGLGPATRYLAASALFAVLLAVFVTAMYSTIVWRRRSSPSEGIACPSCLYMLKDTEPAGQCPECGMSYVVEDLSSLWAGQRRKENCVFQLDLLFLGDDWSALPRAIARHRRRVIVSGLAHRMLFAVGLGLFPVWILLFRDSPLFLYVTLIAFGIENVILFGVYFPLESRWQRRIGKEVTMLCPECLSQTVRSPDGLSRCQACGAVMGSDALTALWARERERADWPRFSAHR
ncbi:MAG TPA: hypothetical protein ENJ00_04895 [Phycisphaerales bacterium]|nr:hypothetical protein [Phycisphaerales bacterium]